jgi:hypothetical protein
MVSPPFDIGTTTIGGLRPLKNPNNILASAAREAAAAKNMFSFSNGAMMR